MRPGVRSQNPDMSATDLSKLLSRMYGQLSEAEKDKWKELAKKQGGKKKPAARRSRQEWTAAEVRTLVPRNDIGHRLIVSCACLRRTASSYRRGRRAMGKTGMRADSSVR